jgi:bacillolysin
MFRAAFEHWFVRPVRRWRGPAFVLSALFFGCVNPLAVSAAPPTPGTPAPPASSASAADKLQKVEAATPGVVTVSRHPATGAIHFIQVSDPGDLFPTVTYDGQQPSTGQLAAKSELFFAAYGAIFGLSDSAGQLRFVAAQEDAYANFHLTYQQYGGAVPVFGGILRTHFDARGKLTAVNGVAVPIDQFNTTPSLPAGEAEITAIAAVRAATASPGAALQAAATDLYIFQPALLKSAAGPVFLAYRVEVVNGDYSVRRFVFVDAHTGKVLLILNGIHELEREVSEGALGNKVWDESSGDPEPIPSGWAGGDAAQVSAWNDVIAGAKETYNLFGSLTNGTWLSYDGQNATMRTVNNDPGIQCPNANWNSISTNYCSGTTGDDTVAHEWAHAYTEYTSDLIYGWQAGALNESYSDIWGEVVDLLNGRGLDSPNALRTAGSCSTLGTGLPSVDNSYRWLAGEDDPAFGGAIRDMWNPGCYGDPGKVTDSGYTCDLAGIDGGGVHTNSGVPNHLFALLVDGGAYNNVTVGAIGLVRAAHIHWRAQSAYLTLISDFFDNADALLVACNDLVGQPLYALSSAGPQSWGSIAPETITAQHCAEVEKAITAVELRTPPSKCDLTPILDPAAPALCTSPNVQTDLYQQGWESGLAGWTAGRRALAQPAQFTIPNGSLASGLPGGRAGQAMFGADPISNGDNCSALDQSGVNYLQSPPIVIPTYAPAPRLAFDHWVAIEPGWDGGNLKIRVNNGSWTPVAASAILFNSYNATLRLPVDGNTNPLAGEPAYSGSNNGSVGGSWGQTQVNLAGYAKPGDKVELRFELGYDGCNGLYGWYIDDVRIYTCSATPDIGLAQQALPTTALPGQAVTYQLTLSNPDPVPASSVVLVDVLPTGLAVNSFSAGGSLFAGPSPAVSWSLASLAGSTQRVFTVTATVSPTISSPAVMDSLTLTATATVTASADATASNNTASSILAVTFPAIGVLTDTMRVAENAGQIPLTLTLNAPNPHAPVQVTYVTIDGSATAGNDYPPQSGTVTIPAGATAAIISLLLLNDELPEQEELFQLRLSAAVGAKIVQDTTTIRIADDDGLARRLFLPLLAP